MALWSVFSLLDKIWYQFHEMGKPFYGLRIWCFVAFTIEFYRQTILYEKLYITYLFLNGEIELNASIRVWIHIEIPWQTWENKIYFSGLSYFLCCPVQPQTGHVTSTLLIRQQQIPNDDLDVITLSDKDIYSTNVLNQFNIAALLNSVKKYPQY